MFQLGRNTQDDAAKLIGIFVAIIVAIFAIATFYSLAATLNVDRATTYLEDNGFTVYAQGDVPVVTLVTPAVDADSATTASPSGLEFISNDLTILRGCSNNQILKWAEVTDIWNCGNDNTVPVTGAGLIVLDFTDNDSNDSDAIVEIAIVNDTNSVFTEPTADKLLVDLAINWPTSDQADSLSANGSNCAANEAARGVSATGVVEDCQTLDGTGLTVAGGTLSADLGVGITADEITDDEILEADLHSVNLPADEQCLTYELTGLGFEWQTCNPGIGDITDVGDCSTGECFTADGTGSTIYLEGVTADGFETIIGSDDITVADKTVNFPNDEIIDDDVVIGDAVGSLSYVALLDCDAATEGLTYDTTTNAFGCNTLGGTDTGPSPDCAGTTTYQDGEGTCDTLNAGTDITADLEEETHAAEHADGGADELAVENLATACTNGQFFIADGALNVDCYTFLASAISDLAGGTDITADLEEELHCAEHSSGDLDCSGETLVYAVNSLDFTEVIQSNTLAGNPAFSVDECYFIATVTGGGFVCEGSIADTSEQLYIFPDVNGVDTTDFIVVDNTQVTSIDGTGLTIAGGVLTADLGTSILTGEIGDDEILEVDLDAVDAAIDEECLTFETDNGGFEWQSCAGTISAADITDLNGGTDITADLEEELHCAEHSSADLTCSGETLIFAANSVDLAEIVQSNTLAGNPTLLIDECFFIATATGGGLICEGSTADTAEQLYLFPDVNGADTTSRIVVDNTEVTSIDGTGLTISAGILEVDLGTSITTGEITDDEILEVDLDAVDVAVDEECLTFETDTGGFEWQLCGGSITASQITDLHAGTDITVDLEEETHAAEHLDGGADEIQGEDLATACTSNQFFRADGALNILCYTFLANAITDLAGGTDITADLEEEVHCAEHSSGDLDCSGETLIYAVDSLDFTEILQTNTLVGNPAFLVDECFFVATATGGGFLCEGSVADTNEQIYVFPDVNGADTTFSIVVDNTEVTSIDGDGLTISAGVLVSDLGTSITTGEITDDEILEADLDAVDVAVDEECLTFETTGGGFEWQSCGGTIVAADITDLHAGTDITVDLEEETHAAEHLDGGADEIAVEDLATACTSNQLFRADGALNVDCYTLVAAAITDLAGGTDITTDLEEEAHCAEHSSADLDCSVETLVYAVDSLDLTEVVQSNTLAGNPAFLVDECFFIATVGGGGFVCEGSIADTNEQIYIFPNVNGVDTTNFIAVDDTEITSLDGTGLTIAGGILTADLGVSIVTGEITDDTILEVDLDAVDAAIDEECLTFETTGGGFEWQSCGGTITAADISDLNAGTDITADLEEETHAAEHLDGGADEIGVEDLATACTVGQFFIADGALNVNCYIFLASAISDLAGGTDITADLEEELHCAEHSSADLDCSGETLVYAVDSLDFTEVVQSNTLAGNPGFLVDECYFVATATGGGFVCEGSTADTNEQLYIFPDVNGADTTFSIVVNDAEVTSIDGTGLTVAGGVLTADLGTSILTGEITDDTILEADLDAVDAAIDEECLTFEATGLGFEWQSCGGSILAADITDLNAGTDITADLEEETHAAEHLDGGADEIGVEDLATACTVNQFFQADGALNVNCRTLVAADISNLNGSTDITADLEEELHCAEHSSADLDCSGETLIFAVDSVDLTEIVQNNTLVGDPGFLVDECFLVATATGGGLICEGSTADGLEQLYLFPDVNGSDTTNRIVIDNTQVTSIDGTGLTIAGGILEADLGVAIVTGEITDDTILEADLDLIDAAGDEECLTFESDGGGDFEWEVCGSLTLLTPGADGDSAVVTSPSGLEQIGGELTIIRGCADTEVLAWIESTDLWGCSDFTVLFDDDGVLASTKITAIRTLNDTNDIVTEGATDEIWINMINNWPKADSAVTLDSDPTDCAANESTIGINTSGTAQGCNTLDGDGLTLAGNVLSVDLGTAITTGEITDDEILEVDLDAVDVAVDEECLTFETTGGGFEWQDCNLSLVAADITDLHASTDITADLEEELHCSEHASADLTCSGETLIYAANSIETGEILDDTLLEADLDAVDAAIDEECLTFETTGLGFEWQSCGGAASILTTGGDGDSAIVSNDAGLENIGGDITIIRGCDDDETLGWDETTDVWRCITLAGTGLTMTGDILSVDLGTNIVTGEIVDDTILEADLDAVDAAIDEECLTFETTGAGFEWQACGSVTLVTPGADADSVIDNTPSGLEDIGGALTIIRGCLDNEALGWDEGTDIWRCITLAGDGLTVTGDILAADLGTSIVTGEITDDTILEIDLDALDAAGDEECLTSEGTGFEWQVCTDVSAVFVEKQAIFVQTGDVDVALDIENVRIYNTFGQTGTIQDASCWVNTAGTTSAITVDVNKDGTTIFTTQSGRPSIAAAGFFDASAVPDVTTFADASYLTIEIDAADSGDTGADLTCGVNIRFITYSTS